MGDDLRKTVTVLSYVGVFVFGGSDAVSASDFALNETTTYLYQEAQEKLSSVDDNDPYALERFKYIVNKIKSRARNCDDDNVCKAAADRDVAALSEAIVKADPTQVYWRPLKQCETAACAAQLVGPLEATEAAGQASASAPESTPSAPKQTEAELGNATAPVAATDAPNPNTAPPAGDAANTTSVPDKSVPSLSDESLGPTGIFWIVIGVFAVLLWAYFSRRKCRACGKRGQIVRIARETLSQHQGTRLKTVRSTATHRSKDKFGSMQVHGETVTEYKVPVATLSSKYLDTLRCKACGHEFVVHTSETRDV